MNTPVNPHAFERCRESCCIHTTHAHCGATVLFLNGDLSACCLPREHPLHLVPKETPTVERSEIAT